MLRIRAVNSTRRIAMLRESAGMSQVELAAGLGVSSQQTIERWESGVTKEIPDKHKLAMAELFHVSVPFLMGWPETC